MAPISLHTEQEIRGSIAESTTGFFDGINISLDKQEID